MYKAQAHPFSFRLINFIAISQSIRVGILGEEVVVELVADFGAQGPFPMATRHDWSNIVYAALILRPIVSAAIQQSVRACQQSCSMRL